MGAFTRELVAGTLADMGTGSGGPASWQRDAADVAAASAGDVEAFERLYRAAVGRVHGLCLRLTADRAAAEELTQEVFLRAWRKLPSYRGQSSFTSWLYRLATNLAISAWRTDRTGRGREVAADDELLAARPAPHSDPVGRLDLERGIAGLPPGARLVFVLHDVEGMRHEEVAAAAGISVGTSKAQLHRARRLLREALQ